MQVRDLGDAGLIPGSGRSSGWGHGNPLQYSCLENPMDGGAWRAIVHRVTKSQTWLKWLSTHAFKKNSPTQFSSNSTHCSPNHLDSCSCRLLKKQSPSAVSEEAASSSLMLWIFCLMIPPEPCSSRNARGMQGLREGKFKTMSRQRAEGVVND